MTIVTERKLTRVLVMLDAIHDKLGIDQETDWDLLELEKVTKPEEILQVIEEANGEEKGK